MVPGFCVDRSGASQWFEALCRYPIVYSALSWAVAVHRNLLMERPLGAESRGDLAHKVQALNLLQQQLNG